MRASGQRSDERAGGHAVALSGHPAAGRLLAGTSGFAYPAWAPRFYPPGQRARDLLPYYATRLPACELNNTFYQRPTTARVAGWLAATPADFRFAAKAQRGASLRSTLRDPNESVTWLTEPLRLFGDRLGAVLFRVPAAVGVDLGRLDALLGAWPGDLPLVLEFENPSWNIDEVHARLRSAGAVLCATERPEDDDPPAIRLTGPFLYLRLRRHDYAPAAVDAWADRIVPFLAAGHDVFAFFRHDEVGRAPELAEALRSAAESRLAGSGTPDEVR